ncbi:hypothetical protein NN561_002624 [Cricetulus griseus]
MLPGPAIQRGAGRAGREATALEPPRPSTPFSCFLVCAGRRRRQDWLRKRSPESMAQASRASRNPEPRAAASAAFVRGRDATKHGGRPPEVAAAARAPVPSALRRVLPPGSGGVALVGAPSLDLARLSLSAPALPHGRDFFFSFPFSSARHLPKGTARRTRRGKVRAVCPGSRLCALAPLCWRRPGRIVSGQARLGLGSA